MKINKQIAKKLAAMGLTSALILAGAGTISHFEGKSNKTYLDPVNILTSCYGHTGPELRKNQVFTDDQCLDQLADDLKEHDVGMMSSIKVPINDNQHAAFLSFTYNLGVGAFKSSTLLKKLNSGDYEGACNELPRWNKADGKVLKGLVDRREAERQMCLTKEVTHANEETKAN